MKFKIFFLLSCLWNNLPTDQKSIKSYLEFKKTKISKTNPNPELYYFGKHKQNIIHSQLGLNCSNLNHNLFGLHVTESCMEMFLFWQAWKRLSLFHEMPPLPDGKNRTFQSSPKFLRSKFRHVFIWKSKPWLSDKENYFWSCTLLHWKYTQVALNVDKCSCKKDSVL